MQSARERPSALTGASAGVAEPAAYLRGAQIQAAAVDAAQEGAGERVSAVTGRKRGRR